MVGDPTEGALVVAAAKAGLWRADEDVEGRAVVAQYRLRAAADDDGAALPGQTLDGFLDQLPVTLAMLKNVTSQADWKLLSAPCAVASHSGAGGPLAHEARASAQAARASLMAASPPCRARTATCG